MLEAGLAVIVACLPTLNFLFGKISTEGLIRSVRSIFSLHPLRASPSPSGHGSHRSCTRSEFIQLEDSSRLNQAGFMSSGKKVHDGGRNIGFESYAMRDLDAQPPKPKMGKIAVNHSIDQEFTAAV